MRFLAISLAFIGLAAAVPKANNAASGAVDNPNAEPMEGSQADGVCIWLGQAPACNQRCPDGFNTCNTDGCRVYCCPGHCIN